ncbi:MAG TPA: hypothetical protein VKB34_13965, partial [Povalibacter sp.]|nr:hypothetical protein [Povalibacter sp.]
MQPEPDDLDRTDQLPQLDVVAYEAGRGRAADTLSTTDTWLVESLPDPHGPPPLITGSADLSINVDRLRQRINALESELATARNASAELDALRQSLTTDRATLETRVAALTADNARLDEQHAIAEELTQRLQEQLREQATEHQAQVAEMSAAREADRAAAEQQRLSLEQQLERSTARFSGTADQQAKLKLALEESMALATSRGRHVDELQRSLIEEHGKADTLARNLASKLAEHDVVSAMIAQRNSGITALERVRDELYDQVSGLTAQIENLTRQLDEANRRASQADRYADEVATRDERLAQLETDVARLTQQLQDSAETHRQTEQTLHDTLEQSVRAEQHQEALQAELRELRLALQSVAAERDVLLPARGLLAQRDSELEKLSDELATVRHDAVAVWAELESQSGLSKTRQQELAAAQQTIGELQASREQLQQALNEARHSIERLHAVSGDDTALLNERNAQIAALRAELESASGNLQGADHALNARDALIEDLRAEIRTAQDERAVMSEQLAKSRARVKTMTQQIFNRDNRIAVLKADLAVHTEALAAIRR